MVQAAGLDLATVRRWGAAAALLLAAVGVSSGAWAQPLLPSSPLTTLLKPLELGRSAPLLPRNATGPGATTPCERLSAGAATRDGGRMGTESLAYAGAGPGEYERYIPGSAPNATGAAPSPPGYAGADIAGAATSSATARRPSSGGARAAAVSKDPGGDAGARMASDAGPGRSGVDRPLYGGLDRPLWDSGSREPGLTSPAGAVDALGRPPANEAASTGGTANDASPARPKTLPLRDRPLWNENATDAAAVPVSPCSAAGNRVPAPRP